MRAERAKQRERERERMKGTRKQKDRLRHLYQERRTLRTRDYEIA